ncbi:hypothetical protein Tco_0801087 [Tanacetum coccineum]|uniref:Uncharacterized protein n=1 Tax=Tanacetum coccineum TaxID=301880 RepID=A0ABQ4ZUZ4_9ASTR
MNDSRSCDQLAQDLAREKNSECSSGEEEEEDEEEEGEQQSGDDYSSRFGIRRSIVGCRPSGFRHRYFWPTMALVDTSV